MAIYVFGIKILNIKASMGIRVPAQGLSDVISFISHIDGQRGCKRGAPDSDKHSANDM